MKTLKDLENLKSDSEKLKWLLKFIDKTIFPNDPLPIRIIRKDAKDTAHLHFDRESGAFVNQYYSINKEKIDNRRNNLESLIGIAAHEVRHRVQRLLRIKRFTKKKFKEFDNQYTLFHGRNNKKISEVINEIFPGLGFYEYDAKVVDLSSMLLFRKGISLKIIAEKVVRPGAKEIMGNLKKLLRKSKKR